MTYCNTRSMDAAESLHLLEAGATSTVIDEREASIRTSFVLLRDVFGVEPSTLDEVLSQLRLEEEGEENDKFQVVVRKKAGVVNALLQPDRKLRRDNLNFGQNSLRWLLPRQFENERANPSADDAPRVGEENTLNDRDLGVLVCPVPQEKTI